MAKNRAKPKDLTGSLVHYRKEAPLKAENLQPRTAKIETSSNFRELAFDPFSFIVWSIFGLFMSIQITLLVWLDVV
jgi:hypothetical protein